MAINFKTYRWQKLVWSAAFATMLAVGVPVVAAVSDCQLTRTTASAPPTAASMFPEIKICCYKYLGCFLCLG
jgi:hypothetical protein